MKLGALAGGSLVGCTGAIAAGGACAATADGPSKLYYSNSKELGDFAGGACLWTLLDSRERALFNSGGVWSEEWKKTEGKFDNGTGPISGCVEISWDKSIWSDNKWKGIIRYEWIFVKGREFIVVDGFYDSTKEEADPTDDNQKAEGTNKNNWRAIYVKKNARKGEKKRWTMWQKNRDIEDKILAKPSLLGQDTAWSFEKSKKCGTNECKGEPNKREHFEGTWKWTQGGDAATFKNLSNDFFSVFGFIFGEASKSHLAKLKDLIEKEKGNWAKL